VVEEGLTAFNVNETHKKEKKKPQQHRNQRNSSNKKKKSKVLGRRQGVACTSVREEGVVVVGTEKVTSLCRRKITSVITIMQTHTHKAIVLKKNATNCDKYFDLNKTEMYFDRWRAPQCSSHPVC
jgi:hypothetical protein